MDNKIRMYRVWNMPNSITFKIPAIKQFLNQYLKPGKIIIDPFAGNSRLASITNDLNPNTEAQYCMDAELFLKMLLRRRKRVRADVILFDPPYSLRQAKEVYNSIGIEKLSMIDTHRVGRWAKEKDIINKLLKPRGYVLSFGWHSNGMGKKRNYTIKEILLVAHGSAHNDTICMAEQK